MFDVSVGALITLFLPASFLLGVLVGMLLRGWLDELDRRSGFTEPEEIADAD
jgi:hypothetical protein